MENTVRRRLLALVNSVLSRALSILGDMKVHSFRVTTALVLVVGLGGCSSDQDTGIGAATMMPTVGVYVLTSR